MPDGYRSLLIWFNGFNDCDGEFGDFGEVQVNMYSKMCMSCLYGKSRFMYPGDERSVDAVDEKSIDDSVDEVERNGRLVGRLED
jgi:hypothetical protein